MVAPGLLGGGGCGGASSPFQPALAAAPLLQRGFDRNPLRGTAKVAGRVQAVSGPAEVPPPALAAASDLSAIRQLPTSHEVAVCQVDGVGNVDDLVGQLPAAGRTPGTQGTGGFPEALQRHNGGALDTVPTAPPFRHGGYRREKSPGEARGPGAPQGLPHTARTACLLPGSLIHFMTFLLHPPAQGPQTGCRAAPDSCQQRYTEGLLPSPRCRPEDQREFCPQGGFTQERHKTATFKVVCGQQRIWKSS